MTAPVDRFALRRAALSDSAAIAALVTQLGYPTSAAQMSGRLEHLLPHPEHAMVVAVTSGELVGMVTAQIGLALEFDGVYGRVNGLVVDARWRGRGLGRILMHHIETWCRDRGAHTVILTSGHHRSEAHDFYKSIGYDATGLRFIKKL